MRFRKHKEEIVIVFAWKPYEIVQGVQLSLDKDTTFTINCSKIKLKHHTFITNGGSVLAQNYSFKNLMTI